MIGIDDGQLRELDIETGFFGVRLDRLCINKRVVRLEPEIKDEL